MLDILRLFLHWLWLGIRAYIIFEMLLIFVWACAVEWDWLHGGDWPNG